MIKDWYLTSIYYYHDNNIVHSCSTINQLVYGTYTFMILIVMFSKLGTNEFSRVLYQIIILIKNCTHYYVEKRTYKNQRYLKKKKNVICFKPASLVM